MRDVEDWPKPPAGEEDEPISPVSDSFYGSNDPDDLDLPEALPLDLTFNGTYVIRKGRKKERSCLAKNSSAEETQTSARKCERQSSLEGHGTSKPNTDLKRASSTFDNIKYLLREGLIEGLDESPPDFLPANPPKLVRVVSLPALPLEKSDASESMETVYRNSKCDRYYKMNELSVTLEEAEDELSSLDNPSLNQNPSDLRSSDETDKKSCNGYAGQTNPEEEKTCGKSIKKCKEVETQTDLSDTEAQNELELVEKQFPEISKTKSELEEVEKKIQEIVKIKTVIDKEDEEEEEEEFSDPWVKVEDKPPDEFRVNVEVLQHEFGPLPPSPVDEDEEEFSNVFRSNSAQSSREKGDSLPESFYRCQDPPSSDPSGKYLNRPPEPLPHRASDPIPISLICRPSESGFNRISRVFSNGLRNEVRIA